MSPYIIGGLIGVLGTLVVWCLTAVRDHYAEKRQQREYDRTVLKAALANYLAALDSLSLDVLDQPPAPVPNALDRAMNALVEKFGLVSMVNVVIRLLHRLAYGRRPEELIDRMAEASAHLRLVAPPEVLEAMQRLDDLFSRQGSRGPTWRAEWRATRESLRSGFRSALDR